jgi:hypothetical protein
MERVELLLLALLLLMSPPTAPRRRQLLREVVTLKEMDSEMYTHATLIMAFASTQALLIQH